MQATNIRICLTWNKPPIKITNNRNWSSASWTQQYIDDKRYDNNLKNCRIKGCIAVAFSPSHSFVSDGNIA